MAQTNDNDFSVLLEAYIKMAPYIQKGFFTETSCYPSISDGGTMRAGEVEHVQSVKSKLTEFIAEFEQELNRKVIGQHEATTAIVRALKLHVTKMQAPGRPIANLLFLGSTGSGKTRSIEAATEVLFPNMKDAYVKISCAEFQSNHEISKLLGCFTPETPVLMHDGSRKPISKVEIGDSVITKFGHSAAVIDRYEYPQDGTMLQIHVSGSAPITTTKGHEIWAIRGRGRKRPTTIAGRDRKSLYDPSRLEFIHADDLKPGDIVVYPRMHPDPTKAIRILDLAAWADGPKTRILSDVIETDYTSIPRYIEVTRLARLFGYFVAEGNVNIRELKNINFTFNKNETYAIDDLYRNLRDTFGKEVSTTITYRKSTDRIYIHNRVIAKLFAALCGHIHNQKRIPECILHASEEIVENFLDAAFVGDGGKTVRRRIDYSTVSQTLASQMEMLIRRLGFASQMQVDIPKNPKFQKRYRIYVSGEQISRFISRLKLISTQVDTTAVTRKVQRECFADDNYIYCTVRKIHTVSYSGKVYDLSIQNEQSYVVQSISVHNSPPGYIGHRETAPMLSQDTIDKFHTDKLKITFVLFDEIEKASDALWQLLLGILDKATLTTGDNRKVDFSNCVIVMTSNLGAQEMSKLANQKMGFAPAVLDTEIDSKFSSVATGAAKKRFSPEFMNRIDTQIVFKSLQPDHLKAILELELRAVQDRILHAECPAFILEWTPAACEFLIERGTSREYGARELKRTIEKHVVTEIMDMLLGAGVDNADTITVDVGATGKIILHYTPR